MIGTEDDEVLAPAIAAQRDAGVERQRDRFLPIRYSCARCVVSSMRWWRAITIRG